MSKPYAGIDWQSHDGLRLYARIYDAPDNAAPTVLCLHGLTRNSRDFEDLAPHLQRRRRVIVPDLLEGADRGHVPLLDEPECVAALDAFLRRVL